MTNVAINNSVPNIPQVQKGTITIKTQEGVIKYGGANDKIAFPSIIIQELKKYSTNDDPNITEKEQYAFTVGIFEKYMQIPAEELNDGPCFAIPGEVLKETSYSAFERFINFYSDERSEGGKDITPNEYTKMLKSLLDGARSLVKTNTSAQKDKGLFGLW